MDEVLQHIQEYLKDAEVLRLVDRLVKMLCEPARAGEQSPHITLDN
jgi:hypothetical protein